MHAGHGRIGQDADVRQLGFGVISQRAAGLGHLHQAEHAFIHPRAAAGGNDDDRQSLVRRRFDQARQLFADHRPHRAAQ